MIFIFVSVFKPALILIKPGFLISIFFLLAQALNAQKVKQFSFRHFSTIEGLAANEIRCTIQDKKGFIWIGTADGLQRYDGTRFLTFRHIAGNSSSLPINSVAQLLIDRQQRMWVLLNNGRVGIFDVENFRFEDIRVDVKDEKYLWTDKELYCDMQGNIIYMLKGFETYTYRPDIKEFVAAGNRIKKPAGWKIFAIGTDTLGKRYYLAGDSGIAEFDYTTNHLNYPGHNPDNVPLIEKFGRLSNVYNIFLDSKQRIWFESWPPFSGCAFLYSFHTITGATILDKYNFLPLLKQYHELRNLIEQKDGSIWIRGAQVFAQFDEAGKDFTIVYNGYVNEQSIYYDIVNNLYEDREQNLWISTSNNGLYLFNPHNQLFTVVKHLDRSQNVTGKGGIMSFTYDNDGSILSGSWGNGIFRYDSNFNSIPVNLKGVNENSLNAWGMCRSTDNRTIWMSLQPGVLVYDQLTRHSTMYNPPVLENRTVRQVIEDRQGNVWLSVQNRGLVRWIKSAAAGEFEKGFVKSDLVPNTNVNKMILDHKGFIWACTSLNGVYKIDPVTGSIADHLTATGPASRKLLDNSSASVLEFNDSLLIISAGGLNLYNTRSKTIRHITTEDGLPSDIIMSMEKDRYNNLWVGMVNGLCRINLEKRKFSFYNRNDGFMNDNFNVAASFRLPDGRLLFGSMEDFVMLDPSRFSAASLPPDVKITTVKLLNRALPLDSLSALNRLELNYDQHSLAVEFAGLTYQNSSKLTYYYKLEGLDKDWIKADKLNQATYSYLPPNNYIFKVKIQTGDGVDSRNITTLRLKIKPPFWRTWWFVCLLAFAALSLFLYLDRLRVMRLRSIIKMRSRIAANFTKDLGSALGNINVLSEMAKVKADVDSERTKEYVNQISDNSSRMIEVMDDMIWSIKPENDELEYTITRMTNYAAELHAKHDVEIHFEFGEKVREIRLRMDQRHDLYTIFKEALTNAAKHSQARYIDVAIRCQKSRLHLRIQDEGRGYDNGAMSFGRGLNDMQKKASSLQAALTIQSEINTGTIVELDMPL